MAYLLYAEDRTTHVGADYYASRSWLLRIRGICRSAGTAWDF